MRKVGASQGDAEEIFWALELSDVEVPGGHGVRTIIFQKAQSAAAHSDDVQMG